jgi:2-dehydro-3-deoxyphosphooctonate aldolase (KDO 8-P synthase)
MAPAQSIQVDGTLQLRGGGTQGSGNARIGGPGGTSPTAGTSLVLSTGSDLVLQGGTSATSGAAIGTSGSSTNVTSAPTNISLNVGGSLRLLDGTASGSRIGSREGAGYVAAGNISATAAQVLFQLKTISTACFTILLLGKSFRGPGLTDGLGILARLRDDLDLPVVTDVHTEEQAEMAGEVCDILQIPAFLCRQTDLIHSAVATGRIVNIKKGQFLAPLDMRNVVAKAAESAPRGKAKLLLTERGTTFGYNNLVADMRALPLLAGLGYPVVFDATHSVQLPGGAGDKSSGQREFAPVLARCAVVAGARGLFIETHPRPDEALSDGPNMIPLADMPKLLAQLVRLREAL